MTMADAPAVEIDEGFLTDWAGRFVEAWNALDRDAVCRIFVAKRRPCEHPLIVHIESAQGLGRWAREIPASVSAPTRT